MSWKQTYTNQKVDILNPSPESIDIIDIAHSLSMICRFTGHTSTFYSVAEHSILVSNLVPEEYALYGLLHDAHETYLNDISTPIKKVVPQIKKLEEGFDRAIHKRFRLDYPVPQMIKDEVKIADNKAIVMEAREFFTERVENWDMEYMDDSWELPEIEGYSNPWDAEEYFIHRFIELYGRRV